MRTELTQDEIRLYRERGFLLVPDFLDASDLELWRDAVDEAVAERGWRRFATGVARFPDQESLAVEEREQGSYNTDKILTHRFNLWQTNAKVRRLMLDERLGKLAADLSGVDGIRLWEDRGLIKKPYATFTEFHRDGPYWPFDAADVVQLWVPLEDVTPENGCLYVVPGTHQAESFEPLELAGDLGAFFDAYPEWKDVVPVPCPLPAGGACFFNGLTVHGAGANMTPTSRVAMTCHYMPDGSTFNGGATHQLPFEYAESLEVGDLLNDDRYNPLVFSRAPRIAGYAAR